MRYVDLDAKTYSILVKQALLIGPSLEDDDPRLGCLGCLFGGKVGPQCGCDENPYDTRLAKVRVFEDGTTMLGGQPWETVPSIPEGPMRDALIDFLIPFGWTYPSEEKNSKEKHAVRAKIASSPEPPPNPDPENVDPGKPVPTKLTKVKGNEGSQYVLFFSDGSVTSSRKLEAAILGYTMEGLEQSGAIIEI